MSKPTATNQFVYLYSRQNAPDRNKFYVYLRIIKNRIHLIIHLHVLVSIVNKK